MLIDILEFNEKHSENQVAFIFFDAQKVFDNIYWPFMLEQLEYTIGDAEFSGMIEVIYTDQKVKILINGCLTETINIAKGTRQGCLL